MEQSVKKIAITLTETAQWHALLGRAEYLLQNCLPEDVTHYLVRLFLNLTREDMSREKILMTAGEETRDADEKLQRVADRCLMISGFYPDIVSVYDVAPDEFIKMGKNAYRALANKTDMEVAPVFTYLDTNFHMVVEMLNRILQLSSTNIQAVGSTDSQLSASTKRRVSNSKKTNRTLVFRQLN